MNNLAKKLQLLAMLFTLCLFSVIATSCGGKTESAAPANAQTTTTDADIDESKPTDDASDEINNSVSTNEKSTETKLTVSANELKRMSTFLSNFVEVGMNEFDIETLNRDELVAFAIWHNYRNNFTSRIVPCKGDCEYGDITIDGKYVAESIKKYFNIDFKDHGSIESVMLHSHYDGKRYHFGGGEGDPLSTAKVKEVFSDDSGKLRMIGETYSVNHDGVASLMGTFEAYAKPHKFDGKDTWSIISFKEVYNDDDE